MEIGIMIEAQENISWDLWRRIARTVEDLGFPSLWRSDHITGFWNPGGGDALDPYLAFAVVAAETSRIRFGPLVTPVMFRHPAMLGRMAAQIDALSGGRFHMGIGAGWNTKEHEEHGLDFPAVGERMDRTEEAIQVMRALWSDGPATFQGRYYQLNGVRAFPKPVQRPLPLLIGGGGERRTLRLVAKYADEWNVGGTVDVYRQKRAILERHCAEVGRDPATILHSQMAAFIIGRDEVEQARHHERLMARVGGFHRDPETMMRAWPKGTPDQIVEELGRRAEAGVRRVMLQHLAADDFGPLELLASRVLPQLAALP